MYRCMLSIVGNRNRNRHRNRNRTRTRSYRMIVIFETCETDTQHLYYILHIL